MSRGKPKGAPKTGGRQKATPNKRSLELLQGLIANACAPAEQIAALLLSPDLLAIQKIECWEKLLPYLYPQQKPIDPDNYLTVEQASGMLGAKMAEVRRALEAHVPDAMQVLTIWEAIHER